MLSFQFLIICCVFVLSSCALSVSAQLRQVSFSLAVVEEEAEDDDDDNDFSGVNDTSNVLDVNASATVLPNATNDTSLLLDDDPTAQPSQTTPTTTTTQKPTQMATEAPTWTPTETPTFSSVSPSQTSQSPSIERCLVVEVPSYDLVPVTVTFDFVGSDPLNGRETISITVVCHDGFCAWDDCLAIGIIEEDNRIDATYVDTLAFVGCLDMEVGRNNPGKYGADLNIWSGFTKAELAGYPTLMNGNIEQNGDEMTLSFTKYLREVGELFIDPSGDYTFFIASGSAFPDNTIQLSLASEFNVTLDC